MDAVAMILALNHALVSSGLCYHLCFHELVNGLYIHKWDQLGCRDRTLSLCKYLKPFPTSTNMNILQFYQIREF